ncbi:hypothetical protein C5Y93_00030 [Blastopirellula marina]|uniref:Uncharacterized protein n=1 Tax=Blastopirellula marina TaxID=124 RepID=A0A2S8GUJ0_9BACT|nr:hypothetical protein C5Y93_00030 [Blastopirellula marina]
MRSEEVPPTGDVDIDRQEEPDDQQRLQERAAQEVRTVKEQCREDGRGKREQDGAESELQRTAGQRETEGIAPEG